jgi:hypothetical protein
VGQIDGKANGILRNQPKNSLPGALAPGTIERAYLFPFFMAVLS